MTSGLLSAPLPQEYRCHQDKKGIHTNPWANKEQTCAETRNLETVILVKTRILRWSLAPEPMKDGAHPPPHPDRWSILRALCGHNYASVRNSGVFLSTGFFNVRDSNKRRYVKELRRRQGL